MGLWQERKRYKRNRIWANEWLTAGLMLEGKSKGEARLQAIQLQKRHPTRAAEAAGMYASPYVKDVASAGDRMFELRPKDFGLDC